MEEGITVDTAASVLKPEGEAKGRLQMPVNDRPEFRQLERKSILDKCLVCKKGGEVRNEKRGKTLLEAGEGSISCVEDEEHHHNPFLSNVGTIHTPLRFPRPQFRKEVSRARWDDELRMGEVIEKKGGFWTNTGIVRDGGRLYCFIEEILFLVERGALLLMDAMDTLFTLKDIHKKVADGKNGCSWELYIAYRRLKSLGYIVGRHGICWTSKGEAREARKCTSIKEMVAVDASLNLSNKEDECTLVKKLNEMQIRDAVLAYDVYLPDSKFKKSAPVSPNFVLCMTRGNPPTRMEVLKLEQICCSPPLKFCHVDNWLVTFVSFEKIELPVLP